MGVRILGGTGIIGPVIPPSLPSVGKDGWGHYWHAARVAGGPGDVATSWPDAGATPDTLLPVATDPTAPLPVLGMDSGMPYVTFAGQDLQGSQSMAVPRSTLIVCRTSALNVAIARRAGIAFSRAANGFWKAVLAPGGSGLTITATVASNTNGWMTMIVNQDPAAPFAMFNGVMRTGAAYTPSAISSTLVATNPATKGNPGDIALSVTWPFYLSTDDATAVYAAVKAAYPVLP